MPTDQDPFRIHILGDVVVDWMMAELRDGKDYSIQPERVLAIPVPGGAWFVAHFIKAALESIKISTTTIFGCQVTTYDFNEPHVFRLRTDIPSAIWDIDLYPRFRDQPSDMVYRLRKRRGYDYSTAKKVPRLIFSADASIPNILVIDDMNLGFRDDIPSVSAIANSLKLNPHCLVILLISGYGIPKTGIARSRLWNLLAGSHADRTIVVVSANALRYAGAQISRRISWESTAEDYVRSLDNVSFLDGFEHIVTRFGLTGAVYSRRPGASEGAQTHLLAYDPDATDGIFRDPARDGNIVGSNSVLVAWLVQQAVVRQSLIFNGGAWDIQALATFALQSSLRGCQRFFRSGYGKDKKELARLAPDWPGLTVSGARWNYWISDTIFNCSTKENIFENNTDVFGNNTAKLYRDQSAVYGIVAVPNDETKRFEILTSVVTSSAHIPEKLFSIARDIVKFGTSKGLPFDVNDTGFGAPSIEFTAPIARYGDDFVAIDRDSIESLRSLGELLRHYLLSRTERPLSIAVFGPPGAGKTFSIKSVAKSVSNNIVFMNCNLTHLRKESNDLAHEFIKILDESRGNNVPLMLFDEFDCDDLAHLKSFLEPMEDSRFRYGEGELRLGRAIFAFAGGVYQRYADFEADQMVIDVITGEKTFTSKAKSKKVPDFLSRLSGHIDILSVNASGSNFSFLIRRAILLRSFLEQVGATGPERDRKQGVAQVDVGVINAFLGIDRFKYGARSIRAIVNTCRIVDGWINKAYLPDCEQLEMHVDSASFLKLLNDSDDVIVNRIENRDTSMHSDKLHENAYFTT